MIVHSVVQSSTDTAPNLFTPEQCLIPQSSFNHWDKNISQSKTMTIVFFLTYFPQSLSGLNSFAIEIPCSGSSDSWQTKYVSKQECIPVGCIPPTLYHTGGSLSGGQCPRGLCPGVVSVQGELCPWGLLSKGSLCPGMVSVQEGLCPGG